MGVRKGEILGAMEGMYSRRRHMEK